MASVCVLISSSVWSQTDTLGYGKFLEGTETLYESPNWGYAFGNNGYGDKVKAQTFASDDGSFVLRKVLLKFGNVQFGSQDSTSTIQVHIYSNTGVGVNESTADTLAPDTITASREVPVYELVSGGFTIVDFSSEVLVYSSGELFSVGVAFSGLALGDTVGLTSTTDGDAGEDNNAWELTANGDWISVAHPDYSWGLDVDLGIFVEIDENDPARIEDVGEGLSLLVYPNPVAENLHVDFSSNDRAREIWVCDLNGRMIYSKKVSNSQVEMDFRHLVDGVYVLRVLDDGSVVTTKFVVQH